MNEKEFIKLNGCKNCQSQNIEFTSVEYSSPLGYNYICHDCEHHGKVKQSNYQMTRINDISAEQYFQAKQLAEQRHVDILETVLELGGSIDYGPEPEYTHS